MQTNVNATRMELLSLRRRVALAERGHKLLSQKRDEISRQLIQISRLLGSLRQEVEKELIETSRRFVMAKATMEPENIKSAMEVPTKKFSLAISFAAIMNVKVPKFAKEIDGEIICYGFSTTSGELDIALKGLEKVFDRLLELAEKEKQAQLLAEELQKTRRRVNALEYVVIPELQQIIRFIYDKLAEAERDNISRLMKITEMIRAI
ncbi:MAG: V-type ATP synthase subunit D [Planctomycetes bacterium]|nr:V-type ATP synthase subunit D [Planctomycetota bacterium]MBU1518229.1 V-type ATP synthase subunit D [Planctomycetota bacterium]MBU2457558.1 V-type ATP synthase subunit D [Planctomycetota bacterium]MBU2597060.1 V-type ATP synthase subunit D [Planctomycetota bacterium]